VWVSALALALRMLAGPGPLASRVAITSVDTPCFDAAGLAAQVRTQLPGGEVAIGPPPRGRAHLEVRVESAAQQVKVAIILRDAGGRPAAREMRHLPGQGDCAETLAAVAMIVVRAALPISAAPQFPPRARPGTSPPPVPVRPKAAVPGPEAATGPAPAAPEAAPPPAPTVAQPAPRQPPARPTGPPATPNAQREGEIASPGPATSRTPPPASFLAAKASPSRGSGESVVSATSASARPAQSRGRIELEAGTAWLLGVDESRSVAAVELAVGWSGPRLGLALRAAVSEETSGSADSAIGRVGVAARSVPLHAEAHLDFPLGHDAIRLAAGGGIRLEHAVATGLLKPAATTVAEPDGFVRVAYRLGLGRFLLAAGAELNIALLHDDLAIEGVGVVLRTPALVFTPFLAVGIRW
jgi:hypothetical protein